MKNLDDAEYELILASWAERQLYGDAGWWGSRLSEAGLGNDALYSRLIYAAMDGELPREIGQYVMDHWETKTARWERIALKLEAALDRLASK